MMATGATPSITLHCGETWSAQGDPARPGAMRLAARRRGALAVDAAGGIVAHGERDALMRQYPQARLADWGDALILPGFIDPHLHYPQLEMIGAHGETLLGWLQRHTYPAEARFADPAHARRVAAALVTELLANGVTGAGFFSSSHPDATEILFQELDRRGMRAAAGLTGMDRNAPEALILTPGRFAEASAALAGRWHGHDGRLFYAVTPRFAPSCSEAMLAAAGALVKARPELTVQTHLAETRAEVDWVRELFPRDRDYLAVYERHGLIGPRTLLGHCIQLEPGALTRLAAAGAVAVHCPTSNAFLGSGAARLADWLEAGVRTALASDIGAGTSLSPWRTMSAAYATARLSGRPVAPEVLFGLATRGGAAALGWDRIGTLDAGFEADFQVIDWRRHRLLAGRMEQTEDPVDRLAALMTLGDDRIVRQVFVRGQRVYEAPETDGFQRTPAAF